MKTLKKILEASTDINPEWTAAFDRKVKDKVNMRDWMNVTKTYISKRYLGAVPLEGIYPKNAKKSGILKINKTKNGRNGIYKIKIDKKLIIDIPKVN